MAKEEVILFPDGFKSINANGNDCEVLSMGRNGCILTTGVVCDDFLGSINLRPISSKGTVGNCYIQIPRQLAVVRRLADIFTKLAADLEAEATVRGTVEYERNRPTRVTK